VFSRPRQGLANNCIINWYLWQFFCPQGTIFLDWPTVISTISPKTYNQPKLKSKTRKKNRNGSVSGSIKCLFIKWGD
jgi:hypothetical protein